MPMRVVRFGVRSIRDHLLQTLILLIVLNSILGGILVYRTYSLSNGLADNQQANCRSGNVVRAHIRFVDQTLANLIDVSLALPQNHVPSTEELIARAKFVQASYRLAKRLPALLPRDCSRGAITSAPDESASGS